jgi:hypothetical protein
MEPMANERGSLMRMIAYSLLAAGLAFAARPLMAQDLMSGEIQQLQGEADELPLAKQ